MAITSNKVVMIDADGTLYRITTREEAYREMLLCAMEKTGLSFDELSKRFWKIVKKKKVSPWSRDHKRSLTLMELGLKDSDIECCLRVFKRCILRGLSSNKGIEDFLKFLKGLGYKVVVFSDEEREFLEEKLRYVFKSLSYFDIIISSEDIGKMKPSEDYFNILYKYGYTIKDIVLVIGDDFDRDLRIAKEKFKIKVALLSEDNRRCNAEICFNDFRVLISRWWDVVSDV